MGEFLQSYGLLILVAGLMLLCHLGHGGHGSHGDAGGKDGDARKDADARKDDGGYRR